MFGSLRKEADFEYFSSWDWPLSQKKETMSRSQKKRPEKKYKNFFWKKFLPL